MAGFEIVSEQPAQTDPFSVLAEELENDNTEWSVKGVEQAPPSLLDNFIASDVVQVPKATAIDAYKNITEKTQPSSVFDLASAAKDIGRTGKGLLEAFSLPFTPVQGALYETVGRLMAHLPGMDEQKAKEAIDYALLAAAPGRGGKFAVKTPDVIPDLAAPVEAAASSTKGFEIVSEQAAAKADLPASSITAEAAPTEFSGNINLNYINAPEDVKNVIRKTAAENKDFIAARRGTIPQEQTKEMAQLLGMTPEKLSKRKVGKAFNAEEMFAARELLVTQANRVKDLAPRVEGGSDMDRALFSQELTRLVTIQEQVSGATAEAGRALAQFRIISSGDKNKISAISELAKSGNADDIARKIAELDDPAKVAAFASQAYKAKTSDMLLEAWINALLSGPQTHATNILSNTLTSLWSVPEKVVASGISKVTGSGISIGEAADHAFGFLEGAKEGIRAGWKAFKTEQPSDAIGKIEAGKFRAIPSVTINGREFGGRQVRIPGRLLTAEDEFFKSIAIRQEINSQARRTARREGMKGEALAQRITELRANPTDEMRSLARDYAAKQTFTNPLGKGGQAVQAAARELPALRVVIPFIRTPVNIVKYFGERSAFAPLMKEVRSNLAGRNGAVARDEQMARIALGSTVGAVAAYMAAEGHITGGGPSDPAKRSLMYADGWQPYSVKVGDSYYSFQRLEPLGMLLGVSADFAELQKAMRADEKENIAALIMASISKNLVSKTWLQGPSDLIEAVQDPERYGPGYVQRLAATSVPAVVAQAARVNDPYLREAQTTLDAVRARIPGEKETLPAKRDLFGNQIKREGNLGPDILSPIYQSTAKNDPAIKEMLRLDITPSQVPRKLSGVELEPDQYDEYARMSGEALKMSLNALLSVPQWKELSDEARTEQINGMIKTTREIAKLQLFSEFPDLMMQIMGSKIKRGTAIATPRSATSP